MASEWVDVADTAVKIGLSSLITGVVTFLAMRQKASTEKSKMKLEKQAKMFEQISDDIHGYIEAVQYFFSYIAGVLFKKKQCAGEEVTKFSEEQFEIIKNYNTKMTETWKTRDAAKARLALLNDSSVVKKLKEIEDIAESARNQIFFEKVIPDYADFTESRKKLSKTIDSLNSELSNAYSKMWE